MDLAHGLLWCTNPEYASLYGPHLWSAAIPTEYWLAVVQGGPRREYIVDLPTDFRLEVV